jgi:hypothetical protein
MKHLLRKIFFFIPTIVFVTVIFSGLQVDAQETGYKLLAPIPTIVDQNGQPKTTGVTLVDYMKGIFVATIGLAIVLAVIEIVIGGIEYVAAAVPSSKEDAKKRIGGAVMGLLLILLAWVLLKALNPALLNVGLNLEKVAVVVTDPGPGPGPGAKWCIFNSQSGQRAGGPEYDTKAECDAEKPPGPALDCRVCDGGSDLCSPGADPGRYPGAATCQQYFAMIDASASTNKSLAKAILVMESSCNPNAVSSAGACGIMQMKPSTADAYSPACGGPATPDCAYLKSHPQQAICMGVRYLNNSVASLGLHHAIASYNAGLGPGAMGASIDCAPDNPLPPNASCAGGPVRKWECPYSNIAHTNPDNGFAETRTYVRGVRYYMTQF